MAEFEYVAVDKKGKTRTGTLSAPDAKSARRKAMQSGLTVLKVKMSSGANTSQSSPGTQRQKRKESLRSKYSNKGEAIGLEFLRRLLELHGSGMPVADAVKLLNHRLSDPQQRNLSAVLWKELAEGRTLSRAMRQLPGYFSESSSYVIEAGEATGNLAPILSKIISHLEEKRNPLTGCKWNDLSHVCWSNGNWCGFVLSVFSPSSNPGNARFLGRGIKPDGPYHD